MKYILASLVLLALTGTLRSQTPAPANSPGQEKLINFDVSSVHLQKEPGGGPIRFTGDGFSSTGPVDYMIRWGYNNFHDGFVTHLPDWAMTDYYVVTAKVADSDVPGWKSYSPAQQRQVLQQFLADRFHLVVHPDVVERPVYSLVVDKGGPKMDQVTPPEGDSHGSIELKDLGVEVGHHATVSVLVDTLLARSSFGLDRQVYDRTGLSGNYDFTLSHEPLRSSGRADSGIAADPSGRPSIFTALQEQLGLKLEPTRMRLPILVVDHIDRPAEN